ncbi:MAG: aspartate carbamoyltransferase catalytic subunit [Firmicutes bacterium]|jgi:aspartate carbamoyltransferase catalytic subunit|nr:aspartate carbamoyltransferase catalytic subunit [Bacillota bacterium]MDH7495037.1 aspartate carbamoyltransferase catalytic subunit [Bacillota bacterium]
MQLRHKDLLGLEYLERDEIELILDTAVPMKEVLARDIKKLPTLRGKTMVNLFYEPSTRTRTSFELAGKWMGADVTNIATSTSSVAKGESLKDTARTLESLGANYIVIRHQMAGAPHLVARTVRASVINAGDGRHEHPTQALLDLFTIKERLGRVEGLEVVIVGDILHSRVARSNIWGLLKLGARVTVCAPRTLIPQDVSRLGVRVTCDLEEALAEADVVNVLRLQLERQKKGLLPSIREYSEMYGLTRERLRRCKPGVLVLHPGPANLGVEITEEVAECPNAAVREQVTNGVACRMAVLYLLSGGGKPGEATA